jgi:D-hexose-6-phosphate mutarotase
MTYNKAIQVEEAGMRAIVIWMPAFSTTSEMEKPE